MSAKRSMGRFEVIDTTADVGIVAHGESMAEAFAAAAEGMFSLISDLDGVQEALSRTISLEADDLEELLVAWLSELLFIFDVENLLFRRFEVEVQGLRLRAVAFGEEVDRARHHVYIGIKAVTYHLLEVAPEDGGWRARAIFDI